MKEYSSGTFISSVIYDKLGVDITPNIKIFNILELIFGDFDKNKIQIKKNVSGYIYTYNNFLFNSITICRKTLLEIALLSKYKKFDIEMLIEDYFLYHKNIEIEIGTSDDLYDDIYFKNLEPLIHKYKVEKRMFLEYIKIPKSHTTTVLFIDESIVSEIDIHINFLVYLYDKIYKACICDVQVCDISSLPKNYKKLYKDNYERFYR